jgi:hypothetical protein
MTIVNSLVYCLRIRQRSFLRVEHLKVAPQGWLCFQTLELARGKQVSLFRATVGNNEKIMTRFGVVSLSYNFLLFEIDAITK